MSDILIEIKNLSKTFDQKVEVLKDINLSIRKNDVVAILGPSGTGKSTLLRCLNFLTVPSTGTISIDGFMIDASNYRHQDVVEFRKHSAMVFQDYNLFKNLTALENVMEALVTVHKKPKAEARQIALEKLDKVGMIDRKDYYPSRLSGGQQQRVGIARALAVEPNVLLFDEPTSALDPELVDEVLQIIRSLANENTTMILVTHEINFAKSVADQIVFMDKGRIHAQGSPEEIFNNQEDERIMNFFRTVKGA